MTAAQSSRPEGTVVNGGNMGAVIGLFGLCWGDVGLFLAMPGSGLGNAAISAVGTPEQSEKYGGSYAAMCITEPGTGSDSANISTTAVLDGDEWVLNGEKIYVTDGERSDTLVVWATLDKSLGKAAIKSFIVEKGTPGCEVTRLEHKMGIAPQIPPPSVSTTAAFPKTTCWAAPRSPPMPRDARKPLAASCRPLTTPAHRSQRWPSACQGGPGPVAAATCRGRGGAQV